MKKKLWVVYSWSPEYPAYCYIKCVCETEEESKKHSDSYDDIEEVEYFETGSAPTGKND